MNESAKTNPGYVKKETLWLVALIAVVLGFVGGVVFSAYRSTGESAPQGAAPTAAVSEPAPQMSDAQASQVFALERLVKENPKDAKAWTDLGNLYFDAGRVKDAIAAYTQSLSLDPNRPDVLTDLGVMYRRNGQPKKALEMFDKAIAIDPKHEVSRFNKGIVLLHDLGDFDGALAAWEGLLKVNPFAMAPNGQSVDELVKRMKEQKRKGQ